MMTDVTKAALNRKEAAQYLGLAENTLVKLMNAGKIKFVRAGRRILISPRALDEYLNGGR